MLLIEIDKYGRTFHPFGNGKDPHARFRAAEVQCEMRRFNYFPSMKGKSFEEFTLDGVRLTRYLQVPYDILSDDKDHTRRTLNDLIFWYKENDVSIPFEEWLRITPFLTRGAGRHHISLFMDYDGYVWVFYLENGKLCKEQVEHTSFVRNGVITKFEDAMQRQINKLQESVRLTEEFHAKLRKPHMDLSQLLSGSDLLAYTDYR